MDVEVDGETYRVDIERAHMEEDTGKSTARRRQHRPDPRRRLLPGRLQPGRHPADRDRHQAGARHRREGTRGRPRVRRTAARAAARPRRERRPDGAGLAALRREPVAGAEGLRSPRHPDRDQERQLAAVRRARHAIRDAAARRDPGRRRVDPAGDPALARGHRRHHEWPGEVRRRRLPLLPRARPRAGRPESGVGRTSCGRRCPSRRTRSARVSRRLGLLRPRDARHRRGRRAGAGRGDDRRRRDAPGRPEVVAR